MTLSQLLTTLANNEKLFITLQDKSANKLITFNATGYEAVESDLGERVVNAIVVDTPSAVTVILEDA